MSQTITNTAVISTTLTTTQTNQGTNLTVTPQTSISQVGNFVTDVQSNPYIQNQVVKFRGVNLRPNTIVHAFFDGVLVDQYCAPAGLSGLDDGTGNMVDQDADLGTPLKTDASGVIYGVFNIPPNTFKSGDRVFELTDVNNLVSGTDAMTTVASATLTASQYISVTKQALTLTTITPQMNFTPVTNTITTSTTGNANVIVNTTVIPDTVNLNYSYYEPLAQALTINTPNHEPGVFATSLDLFFQQKPDTSLQHGCSIYICETNNGYPDGTKVLPYSTVHLDQSLINVDGTAASLATNFKFPSPVYLSTNTVYAFVVKPDGGDPDYHVWTANLGNIDVLSGSQVTSQPALGTAFYGSTTKEWTALQTEYVKFNLNIANFTSLNADAYFNNLDQEFISIYNVQFANTSTSILSRDVVFQANSASPATAQTGVYGYVDHYDDSKTLLYVSKSTGNFATSNGCVQIHRFPNTNISSPNSSTLIATANTLGFYNPVIDAVAPQFAHIEPSGTTLSYDFKGTSNTYVSDANATPLTMGTETSFYDYERRALSKSNETVNLAGNKSVNVHVNFVSDSALVSPVIDTVKSNLLTIRNFVDPVNSIYEEFYNTGSAKTKYISKTITLASGQDAQDLNVILSAYRPPGTDIQIWVKFLNGQDPDSITNKTWTPMKNQTASLFCDPSNPNDYREMTYSVPYGYPLIPTTGTVTGTSSCTTITGTSTLFGYEVFPGWYINMKANNFVGEVSRKVVSIASNTSLVLDQPFTKNYTNQPYYIVPPPTTAWLSSNTLIQTPGTVTTSTTNNSIIGSGTSFTSYFVAGSYINTANDTQQVVSVANDTYLTVGTPWTTDASGANVYVESPSGLTYLTGTGGKYNTFKQFKIKIILQSNDSSKVPTIDNLRAMALQL